MLKKFLSFLHRSELNNPPADLVKQIIDRSFMQRLAEAARQNELAAAHPNQLTPKETKVIFEFVRDLLLDWALERYPGFDLDVLKAREPETFWHLTEYNCRVANVTQPVDRETLYRFLNEYAVLLGSAAALVEEATRGI